MAAITPETAGKDSSQMVPDKTIAFSHLALILILAIIFPTHGKFEIDPTCILDLTSFCVEKLMAAIYLPRCKNDIDRVDVERGKQSINW